jgi:hypothetical protein
MIARRLISLTFCAAAALAYATPASATPAAAGAVTEHAGHPLFCPVVRAGQVALSVRDNGRRVCVRQGQRITVVLRVNPVRYPEPGQWWSAVTASGPAVSALPQTALPAQGVTLGTFEAAATGAAELSATRKPCPARASMFCHVELSWHVKVVVVH